jgi:hypothetical protein
MAGCLPSGQFRASLRGKVRNLPARSSEYNCVSVSICGSNLDMRKCASPAHRGLWAQKKGRQDALPHCQTGMVRSGGFSPTNPVQQFSLVSPDRNSLTIPATEIQLASRHQIHQNSTHGFRRRKQREWECRVNQAKSHSSVHSQPRPVQHTKRFIELLPARSAEPDSPPPWFPPAHP